MGKEIKIIIKFFDLDLNKEIYFTEEILLSANPLLTPQLIIKDGTNLNGLLLTFKSVVKRIVGIKVEFEDQLYREERTITIKIKEEPYYRIWKYLKESAHNFECFLFGERKVKYNVAAVHLTFSGDAYGEQGCIA